MNEQGNRQAWALVDLSSGIDMSTPAGEMVACALLSAAQYERRLIGIRTKKGLASAKARAVSLGKPTSYLDELLTRIHRMHGKVLSLPKDSEGLTDDSVATARAGWWHASSVLSVLNSERMTALAAA